MKLNLARFRKAIVAIVGAAAIALTGALTDGTMTAGEAMGVLVAVLTALGVYGIPNQPPANAAETWIEGRLRTDPGRGPA